MTTFMCSIADSDLYILVRDNVSTPTSSQAKTVTMDNYSYTCKKGKETPYNSVVFQKFLAGDSFEICLRFPKRTGSIWWRCSAVPT